MFLEFWSFWTNTLKMNLKHYERIDRNKKCLIDGYIRAIQQLFTNNTPYYTIPTHINYICAIFYCDLEQFDVNLCGPKVVLKNENKIMVNDSGGGYNTVYGSYIIPSTINNKYIWKFKN